MKYFVKKFKKLLVANRGEIAIRIFRAASELNIRTVAVYTYEDRYSLHRYKADEAYQIGPDNEPLKPYLDMEELIQVAKFQHADAIHPGYGFLSENVKFAERCREEGIIFIGPNPDVMKKLGDKVLAKKIALEVGVPLIQNSVKDLSSFQIAAQEANSMGYPVIIKAAAGGGGRGMRVVHHENDLQKAFDEAKREAKTAFGDDTIFLEKYIDDPKHIEVQIMGDNYGNIVHLFERDCSVQRRFQKIIEIAPAYSLKQETLEKIYAYSLKITRHVNYNNVGTVEFLVDKNENIYFIEVNTRIQVEHTITEEITGIDIVRSQIHIAQGYKLSDPVIFISSQSDVKCNGFAIQCRITTEDPANDFKPDYGRVIAYRNATGFGIRLDEGSSYPGVMVSPFFDSMLVKVSAKGRTLWGASQRMHRALREFRIRGVKTNILFLQNVMSHPVFQKGQATVKFMENHPELFHLERRFDRGNKLLNYLGDVIVNKNPDVKYKMSEKKFRTPQVPSFNKYESYPVGTKNMLTDLGREKFVSWLKKQKAIHYTDTTFRDAHQSLIATRMRTIDMLKVAESFAKNHPEVFSMEVWGGATFDVALRFLHECPWQRLQLLRQAVPNILFQMLLRGSNAVGYTAYPDNLVEKFIEKAWENGIDIFRIFDSLNWVDAMKVSIKTVRQRTDALAEACICYTGDILNQTRKKYTLQYYLDLARKLEDEGAHILAIKDMTGLLKPYSAEVLITELRKAVDLPIHLHTHDTSSLQSATYLKAIEAGVDVIDVALGAVSGLTSQPNFNSIAAMLKGHKRELPLNEKKLNEFSNYWQDVREFYYPFESGLKSGSAEVFEHEIPGGQYSNLGPQARALGLDDKFQQIKKNYAIVNEMFGDVVKVTPSSKVVGDMALYMTSNNLTKEDIFKKSEQVSFPASVISYFKGDLGQPYKGFPKKLQKIILKGEKPFKNRPNAHLKPIEFESEFEVFKKKYDRHCTFLDFLSAILYPKVFEEYYQFQKQFGEVMFLPTTAFLFGMENNEEILVEIAPGKNLLIKLVNKGETDENGIRTIYFKLNGQTRGIDVKDKSFKSEKEAHRKATTEKEIGSPLQGKLSKILVKSGSSVKINEPLFIIEAMKMESTISSPVTGQVKKVYLKEGSMVQQDDLVVEMA